jgi:hypothetical protein
VENRWPATAHRSRVEDVVMNESGAVDELDGCGSSHKRLAPIPGRGEDHEQRTQPLAPGGDRCRGVLGERSAAPCRDLNQQLLDPLEQRQDVLAAGPRYLSLLYLRQVSHRHGWR